MNIPEHAPSAEQFWLYAHEAEFLHSLAEQGYSERSIATCRRFSDRHCDMAEARDIDPEAMTNLADACPTTGTRSMKQELTMVVRRFTKHLIDAGAMARSDPSPSPSGSVDQLCMELDHWLRSQRGMYGPRLQRYPKLLTHFVGHCCNDTGTLQNLSSVTPEDVLAFVDRITGPGN